MSNSYKSFIDVEAVCPFYKGTAEGGRTLRCEGLFDNTVIQSQFRTTQSRQRHMKHFCNSFQCERCALYRAIDQKYA